MKRILLITMVCLLLSGCGIYNLDNFVTPNDTEFIAVVESLDTPEKIAKYMLYNFTYEIHNFYAPDPCTLWQTKKGDCNDMSTFGTWVANYHGYTTYQMKIFFKGSQFTHYVAIYDEGNSKYSITNDQFFDFWFYNFEDIVDYSSDLVCSEWTSYKVFDYDNNMIEKGYNNKGGK